MLDQVKDDTDRERDAECHLEYQVPLERYRCVKDDRSYVTDG